MSGFLHRLVTQAMGVASPVHAAVRSPFAAVPTLVEGPLPAATQGAMLGNPPASEPVVPRRAGLPRQPVLDNTPRFATGEPETDAPALEAEGPWPAPLPRQAPVAVPPPRIVVEERQRDDRGLVRGGVEAAPPPRTRVAPIADALPEATAETNGPHLRHPYLHFTEPLLPPVPTALPGARARGSNTRAGLDPQAPGRSGPVEETTEVHVTIGRIEVTAVHEAPPPRRQAAKVDKPMTLDEYLARRQGRRS